MAVLFSTYVILGLAEEEEEEEEKKKEPLLRWGSGRSLAAPSSVWDNWDQGAEGHLRGHLLAQVKDLKISPAHPPS